MASTDSTVPFLSSEATTTSSAGPQTPASSLENRPLELASIPPYKPAEDATKEVKQELDRAKMPPPPIPRPHAAPRMTRMPSLSEITSHLHIPNSLASTTPKTPPRLSLVTTPSPAAPSSASLGSVTGTTPYTPSGRLKLPASAMTRTRSGSISQTPTLASVSAERETTGPEDTASGEASKTGSPESAKNSPLVGLDPVLGNGSLKRQPSREYVKGYKDVPSLAAIRQRISYAQLPTESADKAQVPAPSSASSGKKVGVKQDEFGDVETVETLLDEAERAGPSTGAKVNGSGTRSESTSKKGEQHALHHPWTLYFDAKSYMPPVEQSAAKDGGTGMGDYEKSLLRVGRIDTVESFARHMNNLRLPTQLKPNSNYHLFKEDIRPMWEDPANHLGGKWVIIFRNSPHLLDVAWANLTMGLVGDIIDPDDTVCGIVASNKPRGNRIQIWTRGREDVEALNGLGKRCLEMMGLEKGEEDSISLEYQYNASNVHPPPNAFIYISSTSRSFTPSTPSRHGVAGSSNLALPSSGGSGISHHLTPSPGSSDPSPTPASHALPLHTRPSNLSINVHHPNGPSPLSNNTRAENRPTSPAFITPSPSPKMMYSLPRAPDMATVKASMMSPSASSSMQPGGGGASMKRLGSGQGSNAFAGPMAGGARSPRPGMEGRLAPPSPVPAYAV